MTQRRCRNRHFKSGSGRPLRNRDSVKRRGETSDVRASAFLLGFPILFELGERVRGGLKAELCAQSETVEGKEGSVRHFTLADNLIC